MARLGKFKPNKGAKKRFRVSSSGKVKRGKVGLGHLCSHKSASRRRKLRRPATCPPCEEKRIHTMLGLQ
ncbi:MAG: 50S ribosomal protein L35 [Planctomycetota bacterium]